MKTLTIALLTITLFLIGATRPVVADQEPTILSLPQGQVILDISATERREITEDLLVATLSCQRVNTDPIELQNAINTTMRQALDLAAKVPEVKTATGSYSVYPTTDPRTKERKWQGSQSLTLKSKEAHALLQLAGTLQELDLTMNSLNYTVDPETAITVQDSLMESALKRLQARADRAASALGKSKAELREVNVQGESIPHPEMMRSDYLDTGMQAKAMAPPVAQPGKAAITLTVTSRALLKQ